MKLCVLFASALGLYPVLRFALSVEGLLSSRTLILGRADGFPIGLPVLVKGVWVVREKEGFFAFPNRCTHLGCPLRFEKESMRFVCRCHGSVFDLKGSRLKGPARKDLPKLRCRTTPDGTLIVKLS